MKIYYSDHYTIPLPEGHRFPMQKYQLLREGLLREGVLSPQELLATEPATFEEVASVHDARYVQKIIDGTLEKLEIRRIGFPWSPALVTRSFATVGGAISAAREAMVSGFSGNLAGGTHHAFSDAGEGFCVFNDQAVVAQILLNERLIRKAAIIDLDVHQGNGTSSIFSGRPEIFVFSMHGEKNFPFRKVPSTLDIPLPDDTGDEIYLQTLEENLPAIKAFSPDIILYQAGVDPLKEDRLGRLSLSFEGLMRRDELVIRFAKENGIPISLAMGGGYAEPIELTVRAHINTYRAGRLIFGI